MKKTFLNVIAVPIFLFGLFWAPPVFGAKKLEKFYWPREFIMENFPAKLFNKILGDYDEFIETNAALFLLKKENYTYYLRIVVYNSNQVGEAHELFFIRAEKIDGRLEVEHIDSVAFVVLRQRLSWYKSFMARHFYREIIEFYDQNK